MTGSRPTILAPMRVEARALRAAAANADVQRIGIGRKAARRAAGRLDPSVPFAIAGFCGGLDDRVAPGDVVLASELRSEAETVLCPDPTILAGALRRAGLNVHVGPIVSTRLPAVGRSRRRTLAEGGALAVDQESAWLAPARPHATLRVVLDSPGGGLHPLRAYRALRISGAVLNEWAASLGARDLVLAAPRASCAGVIRAVDIVQRALRQRGAPVYVRKQIVHNAHVVDELERQGAVFVDEVGEVPPGATVIFSAHGVSPQVRDEAAARQLDVIDATCPLVAKVHAEARRFAGAGFEIVLVGHEGHEEVDGTVGEAPERTHVVASAEEARELQVSDPQRVAFLTQTTLAVDETAEVVAALRERYPELVGPASEDICYATQNRQDAVRALAAGCDLVLVVGSQNSSNSKRLVEVAERAGSRARLVEGAHEIPPDLLIGARRVGLTAGASAPESLVEGVVHALDGLGGVAVSELSVAQEDVHFKLPPQVREHAEPAPVGAAEGR